MRPSAFSSRSPVPSARFPDPGPCLDMTSNWVRTATSRSHRLAVSLTGAASGEAPASASALVSVSVFFSAKPAPSSSSLPPLFLCSVSCSLYLSRSCACWLAYAHIRPRLSVAVAARSLSSSPGIPPPPPVFVFIFISSLPVPVPVLAPLVSPSPSPSSSRSPSPSSRIPRGRSTRAPRASAGVTSWNQHSYASSPTVLRRRSSSARLYLPSPVPSFPNSESSLRNRADASPLPSRTALAALTASPSRRLHACRLESFDRRVRVAPIRRRGMAARPGMALSSVAITLA